MSLQFKELPESALDALIAEERKRTLPPLSQWSAISDQLRQEGMLNPAQGGRQEKTAGARRRSGFGRAFYWSAVVATAACILTVGIFIGRETSRADFNSSRVPQSESSSAELVLDGFGSPDEALEALQKAQLNYQQAVAYLAVHGDSAVYLTDGPNLRERLAALDVVVSAAQTAIEGSPNDPLLRQYYMSSSEARRAMLQLLNETLSDGHRLVGY